MMSLIAKVARRTLFSVLLLAVGAMPAIAGEPDKVAIKGYDAVAYFTKGQPIKGKSEFEFDWNDAQWLFSNAAHRDMFASDPERYAPRFGDNCSMGLALGKLATANPEVWTIVDGKLYLYFSKGAADSFQQNTVENMKKAEANWDKRHELPRAKVDERQK